MKEFITNKKYLWVNIALMIFTYGFWIIIYFYLKYKYLKDSKDFKICILKVAGVTFKNEDGTDRQKFISTLKVNQNLKLVPYKYQNKDAIYVETLNNEILGNIPSKNTTEICNNLYKNMISQIVVANIDSFINEHNKKIYFLKIKLFINI